jgi:hypothetical protein
MVAATAAPAGMMKVMALPASGVFGHRLPGQRM